MTKNELIELAENPAVEGFVIKLTGGNFFSTPNSKDVIAEFLIMDSEASKPNPVAEKYKTISKDDLEAL